MKNIHILPTDNPSRLCIDYKNRLCLSESDLHYVKSDECKTFPQNIYITSDEEIKVGDYVINNLDKLIGKSIRELNSGEIKDREYSKIILTTDQELIADGVQAIDDELLKWFIENPECEFVEISYGLLKPFQSADKGYMIHFPGGDVLEEPGEDYTVVHLRHCYQGEYEDGCKYGEDSCPAKPLEVSEQENCCTPIGQIKRYVDCVGCDRNPEDETVEEALSQKLQELTNCELHGLDEQSFQNGYANGFVNGAKWQAERMYSEEEILEIFHKFSDYLPLHYGFLVKEQFKKK
jgi:hypothetical protein